MKNTEDILEINKRQKEFYNAVREHKPKKNFATRLWSNFRNGTLSDFRTQFDLKDRIYDEHKKWMGDLHDKKVLDLGCLAGNALSLYLAKNAKQYIGIDLSDKAIATLQEKIDAEHCPNAKAIAVDFLSDDFTERDFDIVYAYGVLHHFENFDLLVARLKEILKPGGIVVSYDPLETSLPVKLLRAMYRPFQDDKDWEWPFTHKVVGKIQKAFEIEQVRGILGRSKYGVLLFLLPLGKKFKSRTISGMVEKDWNIKRVDDIFSCMHTTMLLKNNR